MTTEPMPPMGEERIIEAPRGWGSLGLGPLWRARGLAFFLAWRDVKVRYKQALLGAAWAVLQPLLSMAVFAVFFGRLAGVPSDGVPYPFFAFAGLLPWTLFASALVHAANSVVAEKHMLTHAAFPRAIVPLAPVLCALLDFTLASAMLLVGLVVFAAPPSPRILLAPLFVALVLAAALGAGLWLAALNVQYRDVRYAIPFAVQIWLFASPVAYPASLVPDSLRAVYALNPMVGGIEGFRWATLGTGAGPGLETAISALAAAALLASGWAFFRRRERTFADLV